MEYVTTSHYIVHKIIYLISSNCIILQKVATILPVP